MGPGPPPQALQPVPGVLLSLGGFFRKGYYQEGVLVSARTGET